jgi:hypothetical protein
MAVAAVNRRSGGRRAYDFWLRCDGIAFAQQAPGRS